MIFFYKKIWAKDERANRFYSYLSASIGLSFAALFAGNIPKTIPIVTAEEKDKSTASKEMMAVINLLIPKTMRKLRTIPMIPPMTLKVTDSVRNCKRISFLWAPIALRIPISFILSVTETNMMFITPIPHTSKEIAAIPARREVSIHVMLLTVSIISL